MGSVLCTTTRTRAMSASTLRSLNRSVDKRPLRTLDASRAADGAVLTDCELTMRASPKNRERSRGFDTSWPFDLRWLPGSTFGPLGVTDWTTTLQAVSHLAVSRPNTDG